MRNLLFAAQALILDLLPTLVFAVLVALKADVMTATLSAAGVSVGQILLLRLRGQRIAPLQWASLGLVIVFGTAGILAHDPRFLMVKPTLIYTIVGAVMLKRGWMVRYLPPVAKGRAEGLMVAFGYAWSGLMFLTAAANLVVAVALPASWPLFLAVFPLVSKVALFAVQYLAVRRATVRAVRAERAAAM